jgi:hypothetical protein
MVQVMVPLLFFVFFFSFFSFPFGPLYMWGVFFFLGGPIMFFLFFFYRISLMNTEHPADKFSDSVQKRKRAGHRA